MYWAKSYYHDWRDLRSWSAHKTFDGGYIVLGGMDNSLLHQLGNRMYIPGQFILFKLDSRGKIKWQRVWPDPKYWMFYPVCHQQTDDGGYIVAGNNIIPNSGGFEIPLIKFSANGTLKWRKVIYLPNYLPWIHNMVAVPKNQIILMGSIHGLDKRLWDKQDMWFIKINSSNGNIVWQKCYDLGSKESPTALIKNNNNGFIVGGQVSGIKAPKPKRGSLFVIDMDKNGDIQSQKYFYFPNGAGAISSITEGNNDNYVISGTYNDSGAGASPFAISFPLKGRKLYDWAFCYDIFFDSSRRLSWGNAICKTSDSEFVIAGASNTDISWFANIYGPPGFLYMKHGLVLKLMKDGIPNWSRLYGGNDIDTFHSVEPLKLNKRYPGFILGGYSESFPPFATSPAVAGERIWVMKLDLSGNTSHNMACMLHECISEYKPIKVQKSRITAKQKKMDLFSKDINLADSSFRLKEYSICP